MSLATIQRDEDFLPALARSDNEVFYNPARRKSHLGSVRTCFVVWTEIASKHFVIHQPISGSFINDAVEAFSLASDRLAADILRWLGNTSAMRSP